MKIKDPNFRRPRAPRQVLVSPTLASGVLERQEGSITKRSIEDAAAALERELDAIEPADASMWAVVQSMQPAILKKRADGLSWAQIADAVRRAGFPNATESNVRLAIQAKEKLKKVTRARRRKKEIIEKISVNAESKPQNTQYTPAKLKSRYE